MTERDWYQVLGVERGASPATIRAAYVRLAKRHHPDHGRRDTPRSDWLADVQRAYRALSDPERRRAVDHALAERDRRHEEALRRVRRRLRGYDRHPRRRVRRRWRPGLAIACAAAVIVPLSALLLG